MTQENESLDIANIQIVYLETKLEAEREKVRRSVEAIANHYECARKYRLEEAVKEIADFEQRIFKAGFDAGVKAAEDRAQVLVESLERIVGMSDAKNYTPQEIYASQIAREALSQYKKSMEMK